MYTNNPNKEAYESIEIKQTDKQVNRQRHEQTSEYVNKTTSTQEYKLTDYLASTQTRPQHTNTNRHT